MKNRFKNTIVNKISEIASENKFDVYLVGGYVRDRILGLPSTDIDFMVLGDATKFAEIAAENLKTNLDAVYKKFGTALINYKEYKLEFSSARKESYSRDSRKPEIEFSNLEEDLSRRDFTINALAVFLSEPEKIIDLYNGLEDIKNKVIRTPLDPEKTFDDDPLRIMRAIRFASQLQFQIEQNTLSAINKMAYRLKEDKVVSQERVTNELLLILKTNKPSIGLDLMYLSGVMDYVFPEISATAGVDQTSAYHHKDVFHHTLQVVDNVAKISDDVWLRFTALVHDIAKPKTKRFVEGTGWIFHGHSEIGARMMKKIFNNLKLPLNKLNYVEKLVRLHLRPIPLSEEGVTDSAIRRLAAEAGEELPDLMKLCRADITSKNPEKMKRFIANYDKIETRILDVQEKDHLRNFQSPVRGEEIMEICNLQPSKLVGTIKKAIEEAILEGIIPNEYEAAKEYLYKIKDDILSNIK